MTASNYSTTAANNTDLNGIGTGEGMTANKLNDAIRELMADTRELAEGLPWFDFGHSPVFAGAAIFTVSGDMTGIYLVNRRVKITDATVLYGTITASSHSGGTTTVTLSLDGGNLTASLAAVAVSVMTTDSIDHSISISEAAAEAAKNAAETAQGLAEDAQEAAEVAQAAAETAAPPFGAASIQDGAVTQEKLASGISLGASETDMRLAFLMIADNAGDRINMSKGISDPFSDTSDIDLVTSTGESHNASGKFFTGAGEVAATGGTEIGDMINMGGLAAAFDGNANQARTASADKSTGVSGFGNTVGKNWGADKSITRVVVTAPNDAPFLNVGATSLKLQAHNGTDFVDVSSAIVTSGGHGEVITFDTEITDTTAYSQHRVDVSGNGANAVSVAEVQFFETLSGDMTLVSNPFTADVAPDTARLYVQVKENEAITVNTDLTAEVSRDGGTTFAVAVLAKVTTLSDGTIAYEDAEIDISGQPSGTAMTYRIKTIAKDIEVHGVVLQWK